MAAVLTAIWLTGVTAAATAQMLPSGPLATRGNQIVGADGRAVRIAGVGWNGAEYQVAPIGLHVRPYGAMLDAMKAAGFNAVRLAFSEEGLGRTVEPYYVGANPSLTGLDGLRIVDTIVAHAGRIGLKVILDDHRSRLGGGPNDNGLWYDPAWSVGGPDHPHGETQADWVGLWIRLARRYRDDATVIGADLSNEPWRGVWGGGGATDWHAAATEAGNAILAVNPNWLVFVAGVFAPANQQWGEDLSGVAGLPVTLSLPGRVVYAPHVYPVSVVGRAGAQGPAQWMRLWGYVYTSGIAPLWIGEFGANLAGATPATDTAWLDAVMQYFAAPGGVAPAPGDQGISTSYWAWNGAKAPNLSVAGEDFLTPFPPVMRALRLR